MVHLDNRGNPFGGAKPKNGRCGLRRHGISVECVDPEDMAGQSETADLGRTLST
jgi:hypothetical protein